jgi:hypothetical protein
MTYETEALTVEEAAEVASGSTKAVEAVDARLEDEDEAPEEINVRQASERLKAFHEARADKQKAYRDALGVEDAAPEPETLDDQAELQSLEEDFTRERLRGEVDNTTSWVQQAQYQLNQTQHAIQQQWAQRFGDIDIANDQYALQRLAQVDPARAQEAAQFLQQAQAAMTNVQTQAVLQNHAAEQAFQQWANAEDMKFAQAHQELKNPQTYALVREHAIGVLRDLGYGDETIQQMWNTPEYRQAPMQEWLLKLARVRMGEHKLKESKRKVPPVPIKPGTGGATSARDAQVQQLDKKLGKSGSVKDAAALYMARKQR